MDLDTNGKQLACEVIPDEEAIASFKLKLEKSNIFTNQEEKDKFLSLLQTDDNNLYKIRERLGNKDVKNIYLLLFQAAVMDVLMSRVIEETIEHLFKIKIIKSVRDHADKKRSVHETVNDCLYTETVFTTKRYKEYFEIACLVGIKEQSTQISNDAYVQGIVSKIYGNHSQLHDSSVLVQSLFLSGAKRRNNHVAYYDPDQGDSFYLWGNGDDVTSSPKKKRKSKNSPKNRFSKESVNDCTFANIGEFTIEERLRPETVASSNGDFNLPLTNAPAPNKRKNTVNKALEAENKKLKQKNEQLKQKSIVYEQENERLNVDVYKLQEELTILKSGVVRSRQETANLLTVLQHKLKESKQEMCTLRREATAETYESKMSLNKLKVELATLEHKVVTLKGDKTTLQCSLKKVINGKEDLKREQFKLQEKNKQLVYEKRRVTKIKDSVGIRLTTSQNINAQLIGTVAALENDLKKLNREQGELRYQVLFLKGDKSRLEFDHRQVLEALKQEAGTLKQEAATLKREVERLTQKSDGAHNQLEEMQREMIGSRDKVLTLFNTMIGKCGDQSNCKSPSPSSGRVINSISPSRTPPPSPTPLPIPSPIATPPPLEEPTAAFFPPPTAKYYK